MKAIGIALLVIVVFLAISSYADRQQDLDRPPSKDEHDDPDMA